MSLQNSNPPLVSADGTNPTRDIDVAAGSAGIAAGVNLALAAAMAKRLDQSWAAGGNVGAPIGACDAGTKGANQSWTIFLIGTRNLIARDLTYAALGRAHSLGRTSNVATLTMPDHPMGVGGTLVIGGPNGGIAGFDGAHAITAVTGATISFASIGPDVPAANTPNLEWGYPFVVGFDVLASQSAKPALPAGFELRSPLATVTTDGAGNIATVTNQVS
jgi:hypothetical protein